MLLYLETDLDKAYKKNIVFLYPRQMDKSLRKGLRGVLENIGFLSRLINAYKLQCRDFEVDLYGFGVDTLFRNCFTTPELSPFPKKKEIQSTYLLSLHGFPTLKYS